MSSHFPVKHPAAAAAPTITTEAEGEEWASVEQSALPHTKLSVDPSPQQVDSRVQERRLASLEIFFSPFTQFSRVSCTQPESASLVSVNPSFC